jgi:transcriptional regulator with XRE-family HTH domain
MQRQPNIEKIQHRLVEMNLTMERFKDECRVDRRTIERLLSGQTKNPHPITVAAIADFLRLPQKDILIWEEKGGEPKPDPHPPVPVEYGKLVVKNLREGQTIRDDDLPLKIKGSVSPPVPAHVWIVLRDVWGGYYLQDPPVLFLPNYRWVASNILPGQNIERILFIAVEAQDHDRFQLMVHRRQFCQFDELPQGKGSKTMHEVGIKRVPSAPW